MATYTYNPDGLRRSKHVLLTLEQRYIWSGDSMVYECELLYPNNGTVYVYGINLIWARNSSDDDTFYLYNAHGDVVQLVDGNGTIIQTYNYDAFGVEYDVDEDDDNYFRYAGQYYDTETGTYYLRARYYNAAASRMLSEDTNRVLMRQYPNEQELPDPLSLNLYTYCHNNPVMYIDPSGNVITPANVIGALIGAIGGVVIGTAIANYFGLEGLARWACTASTSLLLGVVGWFAGPSIYAAIKATVEAAIAAGTYIINEATKWIVDTLGIATQKIAELGNKLEYLFGHATGAAHNISRSMGMAQQLNSIGILDNAAGRSLLTQAFNQMLNDPTCIVRTQENGRVVTEMLLAGPNGFLKLQAVWEGIKLITAYLFGG